MSTNKSKLQANNTEVDALIDLLRTKASVSLDELTNPGTADEAFEGQEFLDANGKKITGTFTIENELDTQDGLIAQIKTALDGKAGSGGGDTTMEDGLVTRTLTEYENSRVTSVGNGAFAYAKLTNVSFPAATTIGSYAFRDCSGLTNVSFPAATTTGSYAFIACTSLTTVSFPVATTIGSYAFSACRRLTTASFPAATTINGYAFHGCSSLTNVSFPAATTIGNYAFYSCSKLTTLYLTGSILCSLSQSTAFSRAGITSTTGSIYVPASLLASYQAATNWAYFSTRFVGV